MGTRRGGVSELTAGSCIRLLWQSPLPSSSQSTLSQLTELTRRRPHQRTPWRPQAPSAAPPRSARCCWWRRPAGTHKGWLNLTLVLNPPRSRCGAGGTRRSLGWPGPERARSQLVEGQ